MRFARSAWTPTAWLPIAERASVVSALVGLIVLTPHRPLTSGSCAPSLIFTPFGILAGLLRIRLARARLRACRAAVRVRRWHPAAGPDSRPAGAYYPIARRT